MTKYEYKMDYVSRYYPMRGMGDRSPMKDTLADRGQEGWELCAVGSPDSGGTVVCYFKRAIEGT